jgi:proteic killer suppression protein
VKVSIENKHLLELYTTGASRKYRVPDNVAVEFVAAVRELQSAVTIHDIWRQHPKRKFERLKGHPNRYSMRLNKQYRLELSVVWSNTEKTTGEFTVEDLSNHYD